MERGCSDEPTTLEFPTLWSGAIHFIRVVHSPCSQCQNHCTLPVQHQMAAHKKFAGEHFNSSGGVYPLRDYHQIRHTLC